MPDTRDLTNQAMRGNDQASMNLRFHGDRLFSIIRKKIFIQEYFLKSGDVAILILKMASVCMITFLLTFVATVSIGVTLSTGEFIVAIYN